MLQNPPPELLLTLGRLRRGKGGTSSRHILAGCRSTFLASTARRKPKNGLRANVRRGLERGATRREAAPDHAFVHFVRCGIRIVIGLRDHRQQERGSRRELPLPPTSVLPRRKTDERPQICAGSGRVYQLAHPSSSRYRPSRCKFAACKTEGFANWRRLARVFLIGG